VTRFLAKRILLTIPVVLGITIIVFVIMRLVPGDPVAIMFGDQTSAGQVGSAEELERLRDQLGLNDPIPIQYLRWLQRVITGDLGKSLIEGTPVIDGIRTRLPITLQLATGAMIVALVVALPLGAAAAVRQGSVIDQLSLLVSSLSVSIPSFWLALIMIIVFSVKFGWLPTGTIPDEGVVESTRALVTGNPDLAWEWLKHAIMPMCALAFGLLAPLVRITRFSLLEVLEADYIRTARAKGLAPRAVLTRHAARTALIPVLTVIGLQFANLLSGAILIETIFRWPGVGTLGYNAMRRQDYPTVQGVILIVGVMFSIVNLLIDIIYAYIDPRIRHE
jgi:peptide/nickel transport system permease protein